MRIAEWGRAILLMTVLSAAGCGPARIAGTGGSLKLTCWELTHIQGAPVAVPSQSESITLGFDFQDYQGHTEVNDYVGTFSLNSSVLSISMPGMTAVEDGPDSQNYIRLLPNAASYTATNNHLTLFDGAGAAILDFKAALSQSCLWTTPTGSTDTNQRELEEVFNTYMITLQNAYLTGDSSKLPEVCAINMLGQQMQSVKNMHEGSRVPAEDFKILSFKVLTYEPDTASFEVEYRYRYFGFDPVTGNLDFSESLYWTTAEYSLVRESDQWKVSAVKTLKWTH